jgi:hypothetical protein
VASIPTLGVNFSKQNLHYGIDGFESTFSAPVTEAYNAVALGWSQASRRKAPLRDAQQGLINHSDALPAAAGPMNPVSSRRPLSVNELEEELLDQYIVDVSFPESM